MDFVIVLAILTLVVLVVSAPFRRQGSADAGEIASGDGGEAPSAGRKLDELSTELGDLEAAREAKYREIREAELDHRTGKLSDPDYEAIDQSLRAEAMEILRALDHANSRAGATIDDR